MSRSHSVHPPYAIARSGLLLALVLALLLGPAQPAAALGMDILGPAGSGAFGSNVVVLSNGNIVITDPFYDQGGMLDVGAVYLYDGATLDLISTLVGNTTNDQVGSGGVIALTHGNYVIHSPLWDNGPAINAGAITWGSSASGAAGSVNAANSLVGSATDDYVGDYWITPLTNGNYVSISPYWNNGAISNVGAATWGSGTAGVAGVITVTNSLIGSRVGDQVGGNGITALPNGNYVVSSMRWHLPGAFNVGAVTWGNGTTGITGTVNVTNSLIGSTKNDLVGSEDIVVLANGNYVVSTPDWDNGAVEDAGAATWGSGTSGVAGTITTTNSLVGVTTDELVGNFGVTALTNGNYVINSPNWDNGTTTDVGAITWGSGTVGVAGFITVTNSLFGTAANDYVGSWAVRALSNGNYVVQSPDWNNGTVINAGAVTWGNGTTGIVGPVTITNSLVGTTAGDSVGDTMVIALTNGSYVVPSPEWDNGAAEDAGAATWGSGETGIAGPVTASNSLVGTTTNDQVGRHSVTALTNGNYVVRSPDWDNGAAQNAGAVTWGSGTIGVTGNVAAGNSLVGTTANDQVGFDRVTALINGNYVVSSPDWDNGAIVDAGAVTWGSGSGGIAGLITVTNSLFGTTTNDYVGSAGVIALTDGNYVAHSQLWDSGAIADAGAVTWGSGSTGIIGPVTTTNSLVGSTPADRVGSPRVSALSNGQYVVRSPSWDHGAASDAGAVTWSSGASGITGAITSTTSVLGLAAGGGARLQVTYDAANARLVIGRPADNRVTVVEPVMEISGLNASNDGPTRLGNATTFSASVMTGTDVTYTWDFGDGNTDTGATTTHTYAAPGSYTATVTATNGAGSTTASTMVIVPYRIAVPLLVR